MNSNIAQLQRFRQQAYNLLGLAKDATFELMDAVLTTRNVYCLADFSLSPLFRRQWSSVYESLQDCRPNRNKLMRLYLQKIPMDDSKYITVGIDHTSVTRLHSPTLKERGYHHQPSAPGKVTIGQGYSTIAWIPEEKGSWALPIRHERITSFETPIGKAAWQKPQTSLTPGRVAQSMLGLLVEIGTPAVSPKPRGKSSGWEKGKKRDKRTRYPVVQKRRSSQKTTKSQVT